MKFERIPQTVRKISPLPGIGPLSSARVTPFVVGLAHFGVSLCVGAVHLVFVPQLLVDLPHLIRFQVEDTEDRLHPVLDGYALLLGGGKNHAAACQRFFQKFCGSAAGSNR